MDIRQFLVIDRLQQITVDYSNIAAYSNVAVQSVGFCAVIVILTTVRFQVYIIEVYSKRQL